MADDDNEVLPVQPADQAAEIKGLVVERERADSLIASDLMPRRFKNWIVSDRELNTLGLMSAGGTALSAFLGVFVGAAISLGLTLKTVEMPVDKTYVFMASGFLVSVCLSVVLGIFLVLTLIRTSRDVKAIKAESEQEQRRRDIGVA